MSTAQATLRRPSRVVSGLRLDQDQPSQVCFRPAPACTGIVFVRTDLPGRPQVSCTLDNLRAEARWSALEQDGVVVHHTEHVLAALRGCGVDNALVEVDSDRLPVVTGGSCAGFCAALVEAGVAQQEAPRMVYALRGPVWLSQPLDVPAPGTEAGQRGSRRYVVGVPAPVLSVSYVLHVPGVVGMRIGLAEYDAGEQGFCQGAADIGRARTYYLKIEGPAVSGVLSSAQREYIILDPDSPQALVDEVARHKIVDFLGDLHLLGRPVVGRFAAFRTGHRFHHQLARTLLADGHLMLVEERG